MKEKYIDQLINLISEKINQLTSYYDISVMMQTATLDNAAQLIADRQMIISTVDEITAKMQGIINKHGGEDKDTIIELMGFNPEHIPDGKFEPLYKRFKDLENILIKISKAEMAIKVNLEGIKKEIEQDLQKTNKNKQVIDYFSSSSLKSGVGENLNSST